MILANYDSQLTQAIQNPIQYLAWEDGEKTRTGRSFGVFLAMTAVVGYAAYRLFCRFGGQFLMPSFSSLFILCAFSS